MMDYGAQECPVGSSYYICGGGQGTFWSGCCSTKGCASSVGCPADADINISIAPDDPWATSTTTTETPRVTSGVGAPVTAEGSDTIETGTTTGTETFTVPITTSSTDDFVTTSISSVDDSVTTPPTTAVSITVSPTAMSSVSSQPNGTNVGGLPQTATAGIITGSTIAALVIFTIIFLLYRRRRQVRRMSSYRNTFGDDEKDRSSHSQSAGGQGSGDVFAPFGGNHHTLSPSHVGRVNSFEDYQPLDPMPPSILISSNNHHNNPKTLKNRGLSVDDPFISPVSQQSTGTALSGESICHKNAIVEEKPEKDPVQLDSRPVYFELDSAATRETKAAELPIPSPKTPKTARDACHESSSDKSESPEPGDFPNVVKDAQEQKLTRVPNSVLTVVSVGSKGQLPRSGSHKNPSPLRATMNPSADDVKRNRHVASWTHW
ncbi:hypothetical protein SCUP515_08096 [Seiridium cupressi]